MRISRSMLLVAALLLARPFAARAESEARPPDDRAAMLHAESVVVGLFTGATEPRTRAYPNAIDRDGRVYTERVAVVVHEFAVSETLDGAPVPRSLAVVVPGAMQLPATGVRVVIGVRAEGANPSDGYNLMFGRAILAPDEASLDKLRGWIHEVRQPAPVSPEALADSLGQLAAATGALSEPAPSSPGPVHDNPNPGAAAITGPPRSAPRDVQIQGDPRHPPEVGAVQPGSPAGASLRSAPPQPEAVAAAAAAPTRPAADAPAREGVLGWLLVGTALLLFAAAGLPRWRRGPRGSARPGQRARSS